MIVLRIMHLRDKDNHFDDYSDKQRKSNNTKKETKDE